MTHIAISAAMLLAGGYVVADAYDLTPGLLTTRAREAEPQPYPTVSKAVTGPPSLPSRDRSAPKPDAATVDGAISALSSDSRVTGRASVRVLDAATGDVVAERDAAAQRVPASNMKIVTAAVALRVLGPETRLATTVRMDGGTIYLVGGGDTLLAAGAGNPRQVGGRAGIADLADRVAEKARQEGATSVSLAVDSTLFEGPTYQPEVSAPNRGYVMEMRPLAVMQSRNAANAFTPDPDLAAGQALAAALGERGIRVDAVSRAAAPDSAREIAKVESAPVRDLVDFALTASDNTTSDVLGHLVAIEAGEKANFEGAGRATKAELDRMGLETEGLVIADNSGLSAANRLNAVLLTGILKQVYDCDGCALAAIPSGLPVGALNGTLDDRLNGTVAAGKIRAKTGTLENATSLSGYVETSGGRVLVFSVLIDGLAEGSFGEARKAIDDFAATLAGA